MRLHRIQTRARCLAARSGGHGLRPLRGGEVTLARAFPGPGLDSWGFLLALSATGAMPGALSGGTSDRGTTITPAPTPLVPNVPDQGVRG